MTISNTKGVELMLSFHLSELLSVLYSNIQNAELYEPGSICHSSDIILNETDLVKSTRKKEEFLEKSSLLKIYSPRDTNLTISFGARSDMSLHFKMQTSKTDINILWTISTIYINCFDYLLAKITNDTLKQRFLLINNPSCKEVIMKINTLGNQQIMFWFKYPIYERCCIVNQKNIRFSLVFHDLTKHQAQILHSVILTVFFYLSKFYFPNVKISLYFKYNNVKKYLILYTTGIIISSSTNFNYFLNILRIHLFLESRQLFNICPLFQVNVLEHEIYFREDKNISMFIFPFSEDSIRNEQCYFSKIVKMENGMQIDPSDEMTVESFYQTFKQVLCDLIPNDEQITTYGIKLTQFTHILSIDDNSTVFYCKNEWNLCLQLVDGKMVYFNPNKNEIVTLTSETSTSRNLSSKCLVLSNPFTISSSQKRKKPRK